MEKNVGVANVPGIFPRLREKEILRYVYKKQDQNTRENLKQFFFAPHFSLTQNCNGSFEFLNTFYSLLKRVIKRKKSFNVVKERVPRQSSNV